MSKLKADVLVNDQGTIVLFTFVTKAVNEWCKDNLAIESWQWVGKKLAVDHRYAQDLVRGLAYHGFTVSEE